MIRDLEVVDAVELAREERSAYVDAYARPPSTSFTASLLEGDGRLGRMVGVISRRPQESLVG